MPATILAFLLLASQAPAIQKVELVPSDDLWVYPHAADAGGDANLRIWGSEGKAAPTDAAEAEGISMAYLKWDLKDVPRGKKLTRATLVMTNIPNPGYTAEQAKAAPLQVRPVGADFSEKTWEYEKVGKLLPPKESKDVFGLGLPAKPVADKPVTIEIDLLKGPGDFRKYLASALADSMPLSLALTSTIDMVSLGRTAIYKVYSRNERDETVRPKLVLVFE